MSWQSEAFFFGMRLIGLKRRLFGDAAAIQKTIARDRRKGPDKPSARLRARFDVRDDVVDGRAVTTVTPKGRIPKHVVLYLHGGGFIMAITSLHWGLIARLAHRLDAVVVVPDYPLAPEHTAVAVNEWLLQFWRGFVGSYDDDVAISVMGDSAGDTSPSPSPNKRATNSCECRRRWCSSRRRSPATTMTLCAKPSTPTDCMIALAGMPTLARLYAGDVDPHDPRIDLLAGSLAGLPPTLLFSSTRELMHFDSLRARAKAKEDGAAEFVVVDAEGLFHAWPIFPIPEAREAVQTTADFLARTRL